MINNYYLLDSDGYIKERYKLDDSDEFIEFKKLIKAPSERFEKPKYNMFEKKWEEGVPKSDILKALKVFKSNILGRNTEESILNGFNHEISGINYHFSYDKEAQLNIQDTIRLFDNNMIDTVNWTARLHDGKVRITLNKDQFNGLYIQSVKHKLDTISKYRDELIPLINNAQTQEELEQITWDSVSEASVKSVLNIDDTIDKTINHINEKAIKLEEGNRRAMSGLLELTNFMFMGGF